MVRHGELIVEVEGINRIWALRCQLELPLAHVVGAAVDGVPGRIRAVQLPDASHELQVLGAAAFVHDGDRVAWGVRDPGHTIVITLADVDYPRLVVEVDEPLDAVDRINEALAVHRLS
jgi:hypothetical protein